MKTALGLVFVLTVVVTSEAGSQSENCATYFEGCKISNRECLCGESKGCKNTYPYKNRKECEDDIKGQSDPCKQDHCKTGLCVQIQRDGARSYKCDCTATGFYGSHCQHSCNELMADKEDFPAECVEIF